MHIIFEYYSITNVQMTHINIYFPRTTRTKDGKVASVPTYEKDVCP